MLNVTTATKNAYKSSSNKTVTIYFPDLDVTFTNTQIAQESLSIEEMLEADEYLTFIGCNASKATFSLFGISTDFKNEKVEISIQADNTEVIPLFTGYVDTQTIKNYTNNLCEFVAYDLLYSKGNTDIAQWYIYQFSHDWQDGVTVKDFRDGLFEFLDIDVEETTLVNDDLFFEKQYSPINLQALVVIKFICQVNGVFGIINREGIFEFRTLHPIQTADDTIGYYKNIDYQRYTVSSITKVIVRQSDIEAGATVGEGTNTYIMQGNFFTRNLEVEDLTVVGENVFPQVADRPYVPFNADIEGYPWIEVGDVLTYNIYDVATNTYIPMNFYVLSRKLTGIQSLFDNQIAEGDKERSLFVSNINAQIDTVRDQIESLVGKLNNIQLKYLMFYNEGAVNVGDGETKPVANIDFAVSQNGQVYVELEYLIECTTTETETSGLITVDDLLVTVIYEFDGQIIDSREPQETYQDGKHILHTYFVLDVDNVIMHHWKVSLNCVGGTVHIDMLKAQNTILGLGLVGAHSWDGTIEVNDTVTPISLLGMAVRNMVDNALVSLIAPTLITKTETVQPISLLGMNKGSITDNAGINQVVKCAWINESTASDMTYSRTYVGIINHNFVLKTEFVTDSISQQIDDGYCTKVTPMITRLASMTSVEVQTL